MLVIAIALVLAMLIVRVLVLVLVDSRARICLGLLTTHVYYALVRFNFIFNGLHHAYT